MTWCLIGWHGVRHLRPTKQQQPRHKCQLAGRSGAAASAAGRAAAGGKGGVRPEGAVRHDDVGRWPSPCGTGEGPPSRGPPEGSPNDFGLLPGTPGYLHDPTSRGPPEGSPNNFEPEPWIPPSALDPPAGLPKGSPTGLPIFHDGLTPDIIGVTSCSVGLRLCTGMPLEGASAGFLAVGIQRKNRRNPVANVMAAMRRNSRSNVKLRDRIFRQHPTDTRESHSTRTR